MSRIKEKLTKYSRIRRELTQESLEEFGKTYLKHHVQEYETTVAHKEIYQILSEITSRRGQKMAVAAPRGFGKSTVFSLIYILYCLCHAKEKYILIISETSVAANSILENIKKELTGNEKIKLDFPEVFETGRRPKAPRWKQEEIETRNKIKVKALSVNQQIRGTKHRHSRPTLVLLDDIESMRTCSTSESREKLRDWLRKGVLNAGSEKTNFIFLGNLYHVDSLLGEYLAVDKNVTWIKKIYRAIIHEAVNAHLWERWARIYNSQEEYCGNKGPKTAYFYYLKNEADMLEGTEVLWPKRWGYCGLMVKREDDPIAFRSEYQNDPIDPRSRVFDVDEFHYWNKEYQSVEMLLRALREHRIEFYGACDPSLGNDAKNGDFSAIIILAWDQIGKALYVIAADIQRRQPDQLVRDIIGWHERFQCSKFGIEANANQSLLIPLIETAARDQRLYPRIYPITNTKQKKTRIHELQPLTKNGMLHFNQDQKLLLEQMRDFPQGNHDDGPDALEMAVRLSEKVRGPSILEKMGKR
jgi:predicted phage terminase large subunit-like protein